jgi:hypothetical protein
MKYRPDDIWLANWIKDSYDPAVSVWNVNCITNSPWPDTQRLRQYAGGHNETWGELTLTIDSNVLEGHVIGVQDHWFTPALGSAVATNPVPIQQPGAILMASDGVGWKQDANSLSVLQNGEVVWQPVVLPTQADEIILGWSAEAGGKLWLVTGSTTGTNLHASEDGGATWTPRKLPMSDDIVGVPSAAFIQFIDQTNGWVVLRQASSAAFLPGTLFKTQDAGETWQELPLPFGDAVRFIDTQVGFLAGGPSGGELWRSQAGGISWQAVELSFALQSGELPVIDLPANISGAGMLLPVVLQGTLPRLLIFSSQDAGLTWHLETETQLEGLAGGGEIPLQVFPDTGEIMLWSEKGIILTWQGRWNHLPGFSLPELRDSASYVVTFASKEIALLRVFNQDCSGKKLPDAFAPVCSLSMYEAITWDGGHSWQYLN